jgi:uncharacterized integral membrane protein
MKPRTVAIVLILLVAGLFAALNWETFSRSTSLNVVAGRVEAPLGLLMLGVVAALTVVYLVLLARVEASALLEGRRVAKELEKARKLAGSGEESRFTLLRDLLDDELERVHDKLDRLIELGTGEQIRSAAREEGDEVMERIDETGHEPRR